MTGIARTTRLSWRRCLFLLTIFICLSKSSVEGKETAWLDWGELPSMADALGVEGPLVGVSNGALIVAGGSHFPIRTASGKEREVFSNQIYVLTKSGERRPKWLAAGNLPHSIAYGAAVTTGQGVLCLGGRDNQRSHNTVFLLRWDPRREKIEIDESLPPLPEACHHLAAALLGKTIYVAGGMNRDGAADNFWSLDLSRGARGTAASGWQTLPAWPGVRRYGAVLAAQSNGEYGCLYLFGGVGGEADNTSLRDAYQYNPHVTDSRKCWKRIAPMSRGAAVASVVAIGQSHVLVFGGWDIGSWDTGTTVGQQILEETQGPAQDVLAYHTITDTWAKVSEMPRGLAGTTAVRWGESYVIPAGEIGPGMTTPKVYACKPMAAKDHFTAPDYIGLSAYIVALVAIGLYFSKREKTTDQFFLGGRRIPWWAAGLSILATQVSSIGFIAIPAKAYATDWVYFIGILTWFIVVPIVTRLYIPFFRRLNATTAYEYLEVRFNLALRLVAGILFILMQLGRMALVLYLPALALSAVTGLNPFACILVMGVLCTAYTVLGGIEAVIWTDVMQALMLLAGGMLCVGMVIYRIDGGVSEFIRVSSADAKFHMLNFDWDMSTTALWLVVVGNVFARLAVLTADQTVVQRYLTTKDEAAAQKALWADIVAGIPWSITVFALGTALYVFYKTSPLLLNPTLDTDGILPLFIAQQLPPGVGGLLIAAIFAAAMSSLDSSMHSVATVLVNDFYKRLKPYASDHERLKLARWLVLVLGGFGTASALLMASADIKSLWDFFIAVFGLSIGPLSGLFVLGIFTRRAHGLGALVGVAVSGIVLCAVWRLTDVHLLLYAGIGTVSCFTVGYLASLILPARPRPLDGLTIFTMKIENG